ncbi:hypothetical protein [Shinella sp.]|uniref:hypothetical protein n=1 Tax=Shinella sp. TaxID=1870904 RepID=UPI003F6FE596
MGANLLEGRAVFRRFGMVPVNAGLDSLLREGEAFDSLGFSGYFRGILPPLQAVFAPQQAVAWKYTYAVQETVDDGRYYAFK